MATLYETQADRTLPLEKEATELAAA